MCMELAARFAIVDWLAPEDFGGPSMLMSAV
jgi:hypothetical protein